MARGKTNTRGKVKELEVYHTRMNLYAIKFKDGGEIPKQLQAEYNNVSVAKAAINSYLNTRRVPTNAQKQNNRAL